MLRVKNSWCWRNQPRRLLSQREDACHAHVISWYKIKGKFLYSAVANPQDFSKRFTLYSLADLFNQTPYRIIWHSATRQLIREDYSTHIFTVLIHTAEWTGAMQHKIRTRTILVEGQILYPLSTELLLRALVNRYLYLKGTFDIFLGTE